MAQGEPMVQLTWNFYKLLKINSSLIYVEWLSISCMEVVDINTFLKNGDFFKILRSQRRVTLRRPLKILKKSQFFKKVIISTTSMKLIDNHSTHIKDELILSSLSKFQVNCTISSHCATPFYRKKRVISGFLDFWRKH